MAPFLNPLPGYRPAGSGWWFGAPRTGHTHAGIDLLAPVGVIVYAVAAGIVTQAGQGTKAAGLAVTVTHAGGWSSFVCHLSRVLVDVGQAVEPGDPLGLVGATGNAEGPHLHTELRLAGHPVDPLPLYDWPEHRGIAALWLQGRLLLHGFDPGPSDGIAGPLTLVALRRFQLRRHLPVTWRADWRTRPRLQRPPVG